MRTINFFSMFFLFLSAVIGCERATLSKPTHDEDLSHLITIEEALKNLDEYNECSIEKQVKSKASFKVSTIYKNSTLLKSSTDDTAPLLYIINYENNNGYAILSADNRIGSSVIAVAEKGNFPEESFHKLKNRTIYNGYPLTGPGIYYGADSLDIHINPNTFEPYNEELDDYYVGDLIIESPDDTLKKCIPKV